MFRDLGIAAVYAGAGRRCRSGEDHGRFPHLVERCRLADNFRYRSLCDRADRERIVQLITAIPAGTPAGKLPPRPHSLVEGRIRVAACPRPPDYLLKIRFSAAAISAG
jgi:hypothetical protein